MQKPTVTDEMSVPKIENKQMPAKFLKNNFFCSEYPASKMMTGSSPKKMKFGGKCTA